jgi:hypothetical protein
MLNQPYERHVTVSAAMGKRWKGELVVNPRVCAVMGSAGSRSIRRSVGRRTITPNYKAFTAIIRICKPRSRRARHVMGRVLKETWTKALRVAIYVTVSSGRDDIPESKFFAKQVTNTVILEMKCH